MGFRSVSTRRSILCLGVVALLLGGLGCGRTRPMTAGPPPEADLPAKLEIREFVLGPRDEVEVFVWQHPDLSRTAMVSPSGELAYPLVGSLKVAGLNGQEVAAELKSRLARYLIEPQVSVTVKSVRSQKVLVLGEVNKPGVFPIEGPLTVAEAIGLAAGFNNDAETESILLIRGDPRQPELRMVALDRTLLQGAGAAHAAVLPGDILYVPPMRIAEVERFFRRITTIMVPFLAPIQAAIFWSQ